MKLSDKEKLMLITEALELRYGEYGDAYNVIDRIEEILKQTDPVVLPSTSGIGERGEWRPPK